MLVSKAGLLIQKELPAGDEFVPLALYQNLGTCQVRRQRIAILHVLACTLSPSFSSLSSRAPNWRSNCFARGMKPKAIMRTSRTAVVALLLAVAAHAADLKQETISAWQEYIEAKNVAAKSFANAPMVVADGDSWAALRSGTVLVAPAAANNPRRVQSGLIHDWIGTAYIPNATVPQVLAAVRDYDRYKNVYRPSVIDSKTCLTAEGEDQFSLVLINKSLFVKKALEGDYRASYFRLDDHRWYSIAESTRLQEIEGFGGADTHLLPEGEGTGLIWRAHSITRYEERDGGVVVQFEALVLSRDVPVALRWMVDPIVRRVSRESIQLSLQQTRDAVQSNLAVASAH
jgi:hypothetical protein